MGAPSSPVHQNPDILIAAGADSFWAMETERELERRGYHTWRREVLESCDFEGLSRVLAGSRGRCLVLELLPSVRKEWTELVHRLRGLDAGCGLVVIAMEGTLDDEVSLLEAGADVVLSSPHPPLRVVAWCGALLRRLQSGGGASEFYRFGDVEVDVFDRTVRKNRWRVNLSATEFDLLVYLLRNAGSTVTRGNILKDVWKYEFCPNTRTVDNFVCKLRRKLEDDPSNPRYIKTVKGTGYRFEP